MPNTSPYHFKRTLVTERDQLVRRKFNFIDYGFKSFFVPEGGNIQEAINRAEAVGGGIVVLDGKTYYPTANLTLPAGIPLQITGLNMTSTVIDFGSADRRFVLAGTSIYTTGTVSISSGVTVTGSSTNWLSSGLVAGNEIFLDSRWYKIAAVAGNTTIILAEGYGGASLSGATYRAGKIVKDIEFSELTIQNSTSTSGAIDADDVRNLLMEDVTLVLNNRSAVITNFSEWNQRRIVSASATNEGFTFDTGTFCTNENVANVANGSHGCKLTSVQKGYFFSSVSDANTGDGYNLTSCSNIDLIAGEANTNGGQGIEYVSGNTAVCVSNFDVQYNTSDGIKITASSDECRVSNCRLKSNGGYGLNVAAASCDNNILIGCVLASNSSGAVSDSGTTTLIRSNRGVADN